MDLLKVETLSLEKKISWIGKHNKTTLLGFSALSRRPDKRVFGLLSRPSGLSSHNNKIKAYTISRTFFEAHALPMNPTLSQSDQPIIGSMEGNN